MQYFNNRANASARSLTLVRVGFVLIGAFVFLSTSNAIAQTTRIETFRNEVNKSAPRSKTWLLASYKLTTALAEYDYQLALENARRTLVVAKKRDDDNYLAVAHAQLGLYLELICDEFKEPKDVKEKGALKNKRGGDDEESSFETAKYLIDSGASPELRVHYYSTLITLRAHNGDGTGLIQLLSKARLAAKETLDDDLILLHKYQELQCVVQSLSSHDSGDFSKEPKNESTAKATRELSEITIDELTLELSEKSKTHNFVPGLALCSIYEAGAARRKGDIARYELCIAEARRLALKSNNRQIICKHLLHEAIGHADLVESTKSLEKRLRVAEKLKSSWHMFECFVHLANVLRIRGQVEDWQKYDLYDEAQHYLSRADSCKPFHALSIEQRQSIHRIGHRLSVLSSDVPGSLRYMELLRKGQNDSLREKKQNFQQQVDQFLAQRDFAVVSLKRTGQELSSVKANSDFYKGLSRALILCLLSLLMGGGYLLFCRRYKTVKDELGVQKETVKRGEELRAELENRLQRLQRMESLGMMAGGIAHDFNNLLVGVMCNAEIIQMNSTDEDFVHDRVGCILKSAEKAAELSQQMLAYTGKQQVLPKPTDLNELIKTFFPIFSPASIQETPVVLELAKGQTNSKIDSAQIERILLNLISNARSACGSKDKIIIRTGYENVVDSDQDGGLFGRRISDGEFAYLEVEDTGKGISKENMQRMFEPFFTGTPGGKGLGLSVVFGIVDGHNGFIRCQSAIGQGTRVRVYLPRCREWEPKHPVLDDESSDATSGVEIEKSNHRVLIVDDEPNVLSLCHDILNSEGWKTTATSDPSAALALIDDNVKHQYTCILLDVVMPDMGAREFLAAMEKANCEIPVVLMSGFNQVKLGGFYDHRNVRAILEKPFHASDVQRAIVIAVQDRSELGSFKSKALVVPTSDGRNR